MALQGLLEGIVLSLFAVVAIPFVPFIVTIARWRAERNRLKWLTKVLLSPVWLIAGMVFALVNPIGILVKTVGDIRVVAETEWVNRWMSGQPKKPNGHPLEVRSEEEKAMLDAAITNSVIEDYNDEARQYGQGLDI